MLIVLFYLLVDKNTISFVPFMSLFLASAARLLPSFNILAGSFAQIKYLIPSLNKIYLDYNEMIILNKDNYPKPSLLAFKKGVKIFPKFAIK